MRLARRYRGATTIITVLIKVNMPTRERDNRRAHIRTSTLIIRTPPCTPGRRRTMPLRHILPTYKVHLQYGELGRGALRETDG